MGERLRRGHKEKLLAAFCAYRLIVDYIYIFCQDFFTGILRLGLDLSFDRYILSWPLFLVLIYFYICFIFNKDRLKECFSQQVVLLLFLLSVVPFFSMYSAGAIADECCFYYNIFFYVLLFVQIGINYFFNTNNSLTKIKNDNRCKIYRMKKYIFMIMCVITIATILVTFFLYVGGKIYTGGIDVYGQREIFSSIQNSMPRILLYFLGFANIIEIIMLIYCLSIKKYLYAFFLLVLWYLHFSIGAEKSVFVSVIMAIAIYYVATRVTVMKVVVFHIGVALTSLLLSFFYFVYYITDCEESDFFDTLSLFGSPIPADIFRRIFFVPAYLQNIYVGYFADRTPYYWGINSEYSVGLGLENYISDLYYYSPLGHANTGLLGDCFVNMGVYGILVYPIVLGMILYCFDYVLRGKNIIIFMGLALLFVNSLMNSMLPTVMASHGGLVMLLMFWCFPSENVIDKSCVRDE